MAATLVLAGGLRLNYSGLDGWTVEALGDVHPEDAAILRRAAEGATYLEQPGGEVPHVSAWFVERALANSRVLREWFVALEAEVVELPPGAIP